ncbi:unnamed protein product (macronuclear) [Paramecium tetraurelia]|uniref:CTP synthase N-terminal domain-containing protein n=1 Tax=Paramecium tetraurelia TaxID=5888 RepID=A0DQ29_PARTE|nr:uncharacterized protein GSPATT00002546001 [Paramecium tetraurelia]CAK85146.1 unnamed protein product [Paramecium tetraurelia]|eukprot:XP_001452543.1 hypothetical protein (macronuclear) [Paramecium tetraurelia strain d4-2]
MLNKCKYQFICVAIQNNKQQYRNAVDQNGFKVLFLKIDPYQLQYTIQVMKQKEREGIQLGKTVQAILHVVDEIKRWIQHLTTVPPKHDTADKLDILLVEVRGTLGDLESTCNYETVQIMINEEGKDNLGLITIPYIIILNNKQKIKPAQNGINGLRYTGWIISSCY